MSWDGPPDFANATYDDADPLLADRIRPDITRFFAARTDVTDEMRATAARVAASLTAQRGRAPDGREMLRLTMDAPGRRHDLSGSPYFHADDAASTVGFDIARQLFETMTPDRQKPVVFRPEMGAEHPLWNEFGHLLWLEDPKLGLSVDLRAALEAWHPMLPMTTTRRTPR
jgi:hypothetical protein